MPEDPHRQIVRLHVDVKLLRRVDPHGRPPLHGPVLCLLPSVLCPLSSVFTLPAAPSPPPTPSQASQSRARPPGGTGHQRAPASGPPPAPAVSAAPGSWSVRASAG